MDRVFSGYRPGAAFDEMVDDRGAPRSLAENLYEVFASLSAEELQERCLESERSFRDRGITFSLSGEERTFPFDPIPRLISGGEWAIVEAGVIQRVRALEAFLADVYGKGEIFDAGVVPRRLVQTSAHFHRAVAGIVPANGVRIHVSGIDLVRDATGHFRVLEDNVRIPSGVSYVIENRRTMARVFPELFASHSIKPVAEYPAHLLSALCAASSSTDRPRVVVLTPGVYNAAYFEHSFLARQMGVELVEGRDLIAKGNVVYLRTTSGEERVDVIYRRVDDDFIDPVHFRSDSVLGCAGLLNAARAGNVVIANAVGNGVADDKLTYTYLPEIIGYYLGERPIIDNVPTFRPENPDELKYVLSHLDQLVLKPVNGSGGHGLVIGPQATDHELERARAAVERDPRGYIAQEVVSLSTVPTKVGNRLEPRHVDLRPFAVNDGSRIWVLPGGLTRVAHGKGNLVVNSSQGGGSKDTWVLAEECQTIPARMAEV